MKTWHARMIRMGLRDARQLPLSTARVIAAQHPNGLARRLYLRGYARGMKRWPR